MPKSIHHMACNIQGLLDHYKGKSMAGVLSKDGVKMTHQEVVIYLHNCQIDGWKVIPFSGESCEGFDPFGGGCPGHEVKEDS